MPGRALQGIVIRAVDVSYDRMESLPPKMRSAADVLLRMRCHDDNNDDGTFVSPSRRASDATGVSLFCSHCHRLVPVPNTSGLWLYWVG